MNEEQTAGQKLEQVTTDNQCMSISKAVGIMSVIKINMPINFKRWQLSIEENRNRNSMELLNTL